jgi:predicted nucleotidyltransferase component of viral defense system
MSLDPLHEELARIALALPEARQLALAGGGAMLAHGFVDRPTYDIDLFTPDADEVAAVTHALTNELRDRGYGVEVTRLAKTFAHLDVTSVDGRQCGVEIAQDARLYEAVMLRFGRVIARDELAANKVLALFARAYARDLVDVDALAQHYPYERLLELAAANDAGFDRRRFNEAVARAVDRSDADYAEVGVRGEALERLRERAREWPNEALA